MKFRKLVAATLFTVLSSATAYPALAQEQVKLRYASLYSSTDFYEVAAKYFIDEVTRRTNGNVTFETYYGGSLLKARELSPGVTAGATDIAVTVPGAFEPEQFPLTGVLLPYVTSNPYATTSAFKEMYENGDELKAEFDKYNQHLLFAMGSGENTLWTNKEVRTPADLKGQRIRVTLGVADALAALGATPVGIPWSEALDLIQRGGVDGVSATPFDQAVKTGLADIIPYVSDAGGSGSYAVVTVVMNKQKWEALDENTRAVMEEVADEMAGHYVDELDKEVETMVEKLSSSPEVTVVEISDEEAEAWSGPGFEAAYDVWKGRAAGSVDDPDAFFERYRDIVEQKATERPYVSGIERYVAKQGK
ncbi:TRAP transporter substrate-binding protein DctP [Ahrensia kielensis]|uniref:TRAP transporter substrate-binding protein DctP n=1 Tax=Ahrensia kielensis TaxID=76980 RepID=UPI0003A010FD|nr:TRAP transporter substrate-binding protein DctP [Ahrensia kielensis]